MRDEVLVPVSILDNLGRLVVAVELLRRKARVSIVHHETGVSCPKLRTCDACELRYLISTASRLAPACPFCALHPRRGRRGKPRLLMPAGIAESLTDGDGAIVLTPSEEDP